MDGGARRCSKLLGLAAAVPPAAWDAAIQLGAYSKPIGGAERLARGLRLGRRIDFRPSRPEVWDRWRGPGRDRDLGCGVDHRTLGDGFDLSVIEVQCLSDEMAEPVRNGQS